MNKQKMPRCTECGYEGEWEKAPLFRGIDLMVGLLLLTVYGIGIIYFAVVAVIRANSKHREKICPRCHVKNKFTYDY